MFGKLLRRGADKSTRPQPKTTRTLRQDGIAYTVDQLPVEEWLAAPFDHPSVSELGALLGQISSEGYGATHENSFVLGWEDLYRLRALEDYAGALPLLDLPPLSGLRPILNSKGSLQDRDFSIVLSGWADAQRTPLRVALRLVGAVAIHEGCEQLLPEPVWKLLGQIADFHRRPDNERTPDGNRMHWGRIRKGALASGGVLSNFLQKTIVLTPERLQLSLRKAGEGEGKTVEVTPGFEDAPARWIEIFDRLPSVQDRYEIPGGEELTHVVVTPEVQTVLREIKRMPGRRVSGSRAEAFVRNPFALLGPDAETVVSAEAFEAEREKAGLSFERFTPFVERDEQGTLSRVGLRVEEADGESISTTELDLASPTVLAAFIKKLGERIAQEAQCCFWEGYELEILGETAQHHATLKQVLAEWSAPSQVSLAEIFDLSHYSERIEGIGQEKQYCSPFIARKQDDAGWVPENILFGFDFLPEGASQPITVPMNDERVAELRSLVEDAKHTGRREVTLPGCAPPIPVAEAQRMVTTFAAAAEDARSGTLTEAIGKKRQPIERKQLIVKANIDNVDYAEQRADLLALVQGVKPQLPNALRPDVSLKEHQQYGVAWMQHLWRLSPSSCRGALLADDMGLGKTIQLLTFIAACLESDPGIEPVLIVAPVALLENWQEEIEKFFLPGTLPVLTLYGAVLSTKQIPKALLDAELASEGITRLLKKGWVGNAKIVLTTYETLRGLEFSLAAQRWSIMICDEAQKIKNPNAMVTRAAKKQNVRFRIACTGTPVENTLTDIWCLFDFIQAGLLGALSEFGRRYRKPIEAESDEEKERVEELRGIIKPQLLRREKKDVAKDLPAKTTDQACRRLPMSQHQRTLYARGIARYRKEAATNPAAQLGVIHFLRRICSDPLVEEPYQADRSSVEEILQASPKMAWLMQALHQIRQRQEKVIVFCEFRDLQRTLQRCIADRLDVHPDIINGDTSASSSHADSRQKRLKAFQSKPGFGVIVLSPLAVGFGVNIQAANHVIHFTRTWNPAKEDQATDRAYRIGQEREVFVYYPVVVADDFVSFDEKLDKLLDWKRALSADMLNGSGEISVAELLEIAE
ncbi:MAG: DEAD/DEAH box helicase [Candidatus Accumulibacter delftensis]|jgi:hypothetical protein